QLAFAVGMLVLGVGLLVSRFVPSTTPNQTPVPASAWQIQAEAPKARIDGQPVVRGPLHARDSISFSVDGDGEFMLSWHQQSTIRLMQARGRLHPTAIELDTGSVQISSNAPTKASVLEVRTPFGTVREIGTIYVVEVKADEASVRVEEGKVHLECGQATRIVAAGQMATMNRQGIVLPSQHVSPPTTPPVDRVPTPGE
ncbi:MAG TPA: FecR domain-containing protein, partial [Candidatus Ozemobacteraceae bacterium]|nr:FecR domain-containing protein [Candidatus Ozemobacteraceae bacterium]